MRQFIRAGLLDELLLHTCRCGLHGHPALRGLGTEHIECRKTGVPHSPQVTRVRLEALK